MQEMQNDKIKHINTKDKYKVQINSIKKVPEKQKSNKKNVENALCH